MSWVLINFGPMEALEEPQNDISANSIPFFCNVPTENFMLGFRCFFGLHTLQLELQRSAQWRS